VPAAELAIMRRIDELHLDYPFAGSRMLRDLLRGEGIAIGRDQVTTMMRRMAIEAVYRRPHTSKPADGHKAFPYLLRGMAIERVNQVWAMDITYIPMVHGFVYLAAVMDWFSRRVLSWRVSITMDVDFCLDAVDEAMARHGRPEIFNTDQDSQFTSASFTGLLSDNAIRISMDGRGSWRDNVLVERCGVRSSMKRSTCVPMTACRRHAARSACILGSITASGRIRALTDGLRITSISVASQWRWRLEIRRCCGTSLRSGYALPARCPPRFSHGAFYGARDGDRVEIP
jgi:transposase InsO family protein